MCRTPKYSMEPTVLSVQTNYKFHSNRMSTIASLQGLNQMEIYGFGHPQTVPDEYPYLHIVAFNEQ